MSLDIVFGPMFSGKSTYALSYIRRQKAIGKKVLAVKPDIDVRYSDKNVLVTHDQDETPCMMWSSKISMTMDRAYIESDSIVFEEAQFFVGLKNLVFYLMLAYKKNILIVGLDGDACQKPFGEIFDCIPWATNVTKLNALCHECRDGTLAPFTKKIVHNNHADQIDVGGSDKYVSVCLKHLSDKQ